MNEAEKWILYGLCGLVASSIAAFAGFVLKISNEQTKIKTVLAAISKRAAEILHSPDDHHKLDALIEKMMAGNLVEAAEKEKFVKLLESVERNERADKSERLLALLAGIQPMLESKK